MKLSKEDEDKLNLRRSKKPQLSIEEEHEVSAVLQSLYLINIHSNSIICDLIISNYIYTIII